MLKILLVDDEELSLRMLENLIDWKRYDVTVAGTAQNGEEAFALFLKERPEIILTDIRMPGMDGLELMRRVKEVDEKTEFILVSAYADFEYAQKALALGGNNYLLKPVDEYELERTLKKVTGKIDQNRIAKRMIEDAASQKNRMAIYAYMRSGNGMGAAQKAAAKLGISFQNYALIGFMLNESSMNSHIQNSLQLDAQLSYLHNKLAQQLAGWFDGLLFDYYDECWCALVLKAHHPLEECAADMANFFLQEQHMEVHVCFTEQTEGLENLPQAYKSLQRLNQYSFFIGEENILGYGYNCDTAGFNQVALADAQKSLCRAIEHGEVNEAENIVNETLSAVPQRNPSVIPYIRDFCYAGIRALREKMASGGKNEQNGLSGITYQHVENCATLEELRSFMLRLISGMGTPRPEKEEYSSLVQEGMRYLEKNYNRNLSLEEICDALGVSRNYFSFLFKKETGENIWSYLTTIRLNKAKELLRSTDDKTYSIAYQVGYDNPSYFSKLFKKSTGMTPNEYRRTE